MDTAAAAFDFIFVKAPPPPAPETRDAARPADDDGTDVTPESVPFKEKPP